MKTIEFYFDVVSPYSWLAFHRIHTALPSANWNYRSIPVLFARLLDHHKKLGPAEIPEKRRYVFKDVIRIAHRLQKKFVGPPSHPFNPLLPLRVICATPERDRNEVGFSLIDGAWGKGIDISTEQGVRAALEHLGLDLDAILSNSLSEQTKQILKQNTETAINKGVDGVPTFFVEHEMFFGQDRFEDVLYCAEGRLKVDESFVNEVLSRPSSAIRKT